MVLARAAVVQDLLTGTTRILQGIREDRRVGETPLPVDFPGHGDNISIAPDRIERNRGERVPENVTEQLGDIRQFPVILVQSPKVARHRLGGLTRDTGWRKEAETCVRVVVYHTGQSSH